MVDQMVNHITENEIVRRDDLQEFYWTQVKQNGHRGSKESFAL